MVKVIVWRNAGRFLRVDVVTEVGLDLIFYVISVDILMQLCFVYILMCI